MGVRERKPDCRLDLGDLRVWVRAEFGFACVKCEMPVTHTGGGTQVPGGRPLEVRRNCRLGF